MIKEWKTPMYTLRTEQIYIPYNNTISNLCHYSKNLWNEANYIVRQEFIKNKKWIHYNTLASTLKSSDNFKVLNAQTAQQTLKILDRSWESFFKAMKDWNINPSKYLGRPKLPNYKPKNGEALLVFTNQQVKIKDGYLVFPRRLEIEKIKTRLPDHTKLREVRIIPKGAGYSVEIVYRKISEEGMINRRWYARRNNANRIAGIDFGTANIITMVNNIGLRPIVIKDDGTGIKSINQFYNKKKAELQSIYDLQGIKVGHKMSILTEKRNLKIKDAMHKISRLVVNYCTENNIGTVVVGYNEAWKQKVNLGKRNNQNFISIPYYILMNMIQYKGEEAGIIVKQQDEAHTSKCSFLDLETVEHHEKYIGKRIKRGLFRSKKGILINADVNGAYNIIRKCEPNAFQKWIADGVGGCGLHPIRGNIL